MRRIFLRSLVGVAVVAGSHAFAAGTTGSDTTQASPPSEQAPQRDQVRRPDSSKHIAATAKPKKHPEPLSAAYTAATRDAGVPATSAHTAAPPSSAQAPWTGFHIGVNGGAAK
jgi:hypothetical protein